MRCTQTQEIIAETKNPKSIMMGDDLQSKDLFKRHFKSLEGRYELLYEKSYPSALLPTHPQARQVSRVTLAELKEGSPEHSIPTTTPTITATVGGGVRSLASWLLDAASYCKTGDVSGTSRPSSVDGPSSSNLAAGSTFDGKGSFLVFNVDDALFISDLNSPSKYPIKSIVFSIGFPVCHAFDAEATDGHDLVIGMSNGDVYTVSLREQLQNAGKKLVGAYRYIRSSSYIKSRCCNVAWAPKGHGTFVVSHRDGNLYVYDKVCILRFYDQIPSFRQLCCRLPLLLQNKDGAPDPFLPMTKDKTLFSVSANSKTNPVARWHRSDKTIYDVAFSNDGAYMATVGADRYLRVFDFAKQELLWHDKSCVLICCAWSADGKYILAGGDDDNVHVWSMDLQQMIAWGQGHKGWVMGVAFDPFWSSPSSENARQAVTYRFGSVCMNGNLLLWDLTPSDIAILQPLHQPIDGSHGSCSESTHPGSARFSAIPLSSPKAKDTMELLPLVKRRVHHDLSGLIFTPESVLTFAWEGLIKIWMKPKGQNDSQRRDEERTSSSPGVKLRLGKASNEEKKY